VSDDRRVQKRYGQWYAPGEWNVYCQRCGRKIKSSKARKEWDGLWTCPQCYDERQPQDLVRGIADRQAVPFAAPESPDQIIPLVDLPVTGLTTAPFAAGPENLWDGVNTLQVQISGGALSSSTDLGVLNGANMCAVMNASGAWEVVQFVNATLTGAGKYTLSRLLRGRAGTEQAMAGSFPAGSPFVFLGQSSASVYDQMGQYLGAGLYPFSVCNVMFYTDNGDLIITWTRRSRIPRLDQDDFDPMISDPIGESAERYEADIINAGAVIRTLYADGTPSVTYPLSAQLYDFGTQQPAYTINVYQVSPDRFTINDGRSPPRQAIAVMATLTSFDDLADGLAETLVDANGYGLVS